MAFLKIYDSAGKEVDLAAHQIDFSEGFLVVERATGRTVCDIKMGLDGVPLTDDPDGSLITELDVSIELYTPDGFLFKATPEQTNLSGPVTSGETYIGRDAAIIIA